MHHQQHPISRKFTGRRVLVTLSLALSAVASGMVAAPVGAAEPEKLAPISAGAFRLATDENQWTQYQQGIAAVERSGAVSAATPLNVATSGQHKGRPGLCHGVAPLETRLVPDGFCWDQVDDNTNSWSAGGGWTPQGMSASHDSTPTGTVGGSHLYLASWYFARCKQQDSPGTCDHGKDAQGNDKAGRETESLARISIVKNAGSTSTTYGHVLLVRPDPSPTTNFSAVDNTHADGMVWYGNRLFIANGGELQVYDMRHLWRMTTIAAKIGVTDGKTSSARWHQWAMPMIGSYRIPGAGAARDCAPGTGRLCLSTLSLDRSTYPDSLISAEHVSYGASAPSKGDPPQRGNRGRVVRWPLNADVALPKADDGTGIGNVTATAAYTSPVWAMQGAATDGTYFYMSGACPPSWSEHPNPGSTEAYSCIHRAKAGEAPVALSKSPRLTQNLSYAPNSGRLWGLNESLYGPDGDRSVFSLKVR
ncbi:hypothetical protein ABZ154_26930 [Streptomyces sp. NPDC006261]|uniref:hypothetical protein n=1 Tax=Streptomyces sp. NPDC006261 TaxID=3156739 RepID=UPI0033BB196C